jgi:DNA replication protein DnaC
MQLINQVKTLLNQLGLHGVELGLSNAKLDNNQTFYELLIDLLNKEIEYKKSRSLSYRLKIAKFPQVKLLSDTQAAKLVANVDIVEVIQNKENVFFIGGCGSAKTHLAIALAYQALELGKRVKFYTLADLSRHLLQAQEHNYEMRLMLSLQKFDALVIDELGYVPIDKKAATLLFELFAKLYEQTSLLITTHLKFDEWSNMFGDLKVTKVVIDRLTHHCRIIETGNISYRIKRSEEMVT